MYHIPRSGFPNAYAGQTSRELYTRVNEHEGTVRRQDENPLRVRHCLTTGHAFDWDRPSVIGSGTIGYCSINTINIYVRVFMKAWQTAAT